MRDLNTVEVSQLLNSAANPKQSLLDGLADAIDLASDQDGITWLLYKGKRVAAIVPVDVAENAGPVSGEWDSPGTSEEF